METNYDFTIRFMYFAHNYSHNFIQKAWGENTPLADHLQSKFITMYDKHGTLTIFRWFMELDHTNKAVLLHWIDFNYKQ